MVGGVLSKHLNSQSALYRRVVGSPLRPFAGVLYDAVVGLELTAIKLFSRRRCDATSCLPLEQELTVITKTFERPKTLRRLVASIKHYYPQLRIIAADDSRCPAQLPGVDIIPMPYDSGISAGRNEALRQVQTPYFLLIDDDHLFFNGTLLEPVIELMHRYPQVDVIGGRVINLPFCRITGGGGMVYRTNREAVLPQGTRLGPLCVHHKVANFFVASTERTRLVQWDPALKRLEHADFFTRAKGILTTVYNPDFAILHARTPFNPCYLQKRYELSEARRLLAEKYPEG